MRRNVCCLCEKAQRKKKSLWQSSIMVLCRLRNRFRGYNEIVFWSKQDLFALLRGIELVLVLERTYKRWRKEADSIIHGSLPHILYIGKISFPTEFNHESLKASKGAKTIPSILQNLRPNMRKKAIV